MNFNLKRLHSIVLLILLVAINNISLYSNETISLTEDMIVSDLVTNTESTFILDTFDDFELVVDDSDIDSMKFSDNITFGFTGASTNWIDDIETYRFEFTDEFNQDLIYNCSDFDIEVKFNHHSTSSYWGDLHIRLGTYYQTPSLFNETGKTICLGAINDAWSASEGIHHLTGYPYDVKDKYDSAYGTLPASGITTVHMNRTGSTFICEIFEDGAPIISHTWTEGMDQPVNYISIRVYTGTTIPDFTISVEDIIGTFEMETPEIDYIEITDFSAFKLHLDNESVDSFNTNSEVYFDFLGSTNDYPLREEYLLTFDEFGNATYFEIYLTFNYTQDSIDDALTFRPFVGSYYNYSGEYIGLPYPGNNSHLCGAGIWDSSEVATPAYVNIGYPNGVKDRIASADGAAPLYQEIITHFVRNESGLYVELLEADTLDYIESCYWGSGIDIPINYVMLDFYSGRSHSHVSVFVSEINGVICFGPDSIDIPHPSVEEPDMPYVYVSSPTSGTTIHTSTVIITWIVQNEGAGIDYFEVMLNEDGYTNVGLATTISYYNLTDGQYTFQVRAVDLAEQTMTYGIVFTIDVDNNETPSATTPPPSNTNFTFNIPGFTLPIILFSIGILCYLRKEKEKN